MTRHFPCDRLVTNGALGIFYHAKPQSRKDTKTQRHKEQELFLSSSLCAFAALRVNV
jgi:hypothetical protein